MFHGIVGDETVVSVWYKPRVAACKPENKKSSKTAGSPRRVGPTLSCSSLTRRKSTTLVNIPMLDGGLRDRDVPAISGHSRFRLFGIIIIYNGFNDSYGRELLANDSS